MADANDRNDELRRSADERNRVREREHHLLELRRVTEAQEKEFEAYRRRAQEELNKREIAFRKELEAREVAFEERERKLLERQREFEMRLNMRESQSDALRERLQMEVQEREMKLKEAMEALAREKERYKEESRKKIERTSKDYVSEALQTLSSKEQSYHSVARVWSAVGALSLIAAVTYFGYFTVKATVIPDPMTWPFIVFASLKGFFVVALLAALAKYSYLFSRSYMQESLKNADRRHAINFGKFYLESYGAAADWGQVKEAFEHWNISSANSFGQAETTGLDFSSLEKTLDAFERAGKVAAKVRDGGGG